jgi:hypothetical protein
MTHNARHLYCQASGPGSWDVKLIKVTEIENTLICDPEAGTEAEQNNCR